MNDRKRYYLINLFCLIIACWSCASTKTNPATGQKASANQTGIQKIALDQLGQLYVVHSNNSIIQYRVDGSEGFRYNNNTLGKLGTIDPTNPFSILLFYPDFQTIILLDRTLNEKTQIDLSALGLLNIELVGLSNDNFIWIYDAADVQLKKLTSEGSISLQSDRLNLLLPQIPDPSQLLVFNNQVVLHDSNLGVLLFDQFGRYETTLPIKGASAIQLVDDHTLLYLRDGAILSYDIRSFQETLVPIKISCKTECQIRFGKEKVYWLEDGELRQKVIEK